MQEQHVYISVLHIQDNYNFLKSVILSRYINIFMIIILPLTLLSYIFKSAKLSYLLVYVLTDYAR